MEEHKMRVIYEPAGRAREYSPLAVNLYKGCNHGCKYCFAPDCTRTDRQMFYTSQTDRKDIIKKLALDCKDMQGDHTPVLLCFTCDPYQKLDDKLKLTRQALQLFYEYGITFQILTKAGTKAERDFGLYKPDDAFATTLTFMDEQKSLKYEPYAALPNDRIQAIKDAKKAGIKTWVSFEPVMNDEEVYKLLDATYEYVDLYKVGKISNFATDKPINWKQFGNEIINRLERYKKEYYIKRDLKMCL